MKLLFRKVAGVEAYQLRSHPGHDTDHLRQPREPALEAPLLLVQRVGAGDRAGGRNARAGARVLGHLRYALQASNIAE